MTISEFIGACDQFCAKHDVSRVWLSKRLFADTYRIDHLAAGKTDVGVKRLERAVTELGQLEKEKGAEATRSAQGAAA